MGHMPGSTFHTSRTARSRRRADGPVLTLLEGTGGSTGTTSRVAPARHHPGFEGFTPDGRTDEFGRAVQSSEPGAPTPFLTSRGNATPDSGVTAHPGSGPTISQEAFARLLETYLEATAGDVPADPSPARLRAVR